MAEQQQNALTSAFPSPPNFYTHFTQPNLDRLAALLKAQHDASTQHTSMSHPDTTSAGDATTALIIPNLPIDLRYLQPPPPPKDGLYRSFGDTFNLNDTLPTLAEQGIEQLYTPSPSPTHPSSPSDSLTHTSKALILKRLAKSLLLNFLEFMGILSTNPEQYAEKLQDLRTLFINFHHLLNEYRPHQAREQVILLMENEVARVRSEREGIENMRVKVQSLLENLGKTPLLEERLPKFEDPKVIEKEKKDEYEQSIWQELKDEFGGRRNSGASYFEDETHWEHDRGWAGGQYPHV